MNEKVFITGSSTGLGMLAAKELIKDGYEVYLHARNAERAKNALEECSQAKDVLIGDLSHLDELQKVAKEINDLGEFSTIIHNAGVYIANSNLTFRVNVLAPYVLTSLIHKPKQLIYIASNMHMDAKLNIGEIANDLSYSGSKLAILLLMKKVARLYPHVKVSAVDPGWVPTRMGGQAAPDSLMDGYETQVWLTEARDNIVTGNYYYHQRIQNYDQRVDSTILQDKLVNSLYQLTGFKL